MDDGNQDISNDISMVKSNKRNRKNFKNGPIIKRKLNIVTVMRIDISNIIRML